MDKNKQDEPKEDEEEKEEKSIEDKVKMAFDNAKGDVKEDVLSEAKEEIKTLVEKELEKKEKKLGAYNQKDEEDEEESQEEKNKKFMNTLKKVVEDNETIKTKELNTTDPSEVVDEEIEFEIMSADEEYGVARELFRVHELSQNQYSANELATDVSVGWIGESATISSTGITVTQNTLELKKLAAIVVMSNEILSDSQIDLRSFLTDRIGLAFANEEDRVFLNGDSGSGDPVDGLLNKSDVEELILDTGNTSVSDMDQEDLLNLQGEVPSSVRNNGSYVMEFSVFAEIRTWTDSNNNPIYKNVAGEGPATIHGKPVVVSDVMPSVSDVTAGDSFILFGDFTRGVVLGTKGGLRIDSAISGVVSDEDSDDMFETDRVAIRFIQRVGYEYVLSNTVAKLTTHSS